MTSSPPVKRLSIAITAAVAMTTVAIGVTAASLLGWFTPATSDAPAEPGGVVETPAPIDPAPAPPSVIYVPIVPAAPAAESMLARQEVDDDGGAEARYRHHDDDDDDDDDEDDDDDDDDDDEDDDD